MTTIHGARAALDAQLNRPVHTLADLADYVRLAHPELPPRTRQEMLAAHSPPCREQRASRLPFCPPSRKPCAVSWPGCRRSWPGYPKGAGATCAACCARRSCRPPRTTVWGSTATTVPRWAVCLALLPDATARRRLARLSGFCSLEGVEPQQVDDGVLDRFLVSLLADPLNPGPYRVHREAIKTWNAQVGTDSWPPAVLSLPGVRPGGQRERDVLPPAPSICRAACARASGVQSAVSACSQQS